MAPWRGGPLVAPTASRVSLLIYRPPAPLLACPSDRARGARRRRCVGPRGPLAAPARRAVALPTRTAAVCRRRSAASHPALRTPARPAAARGQRRAPPPPPRAAAAIRRAAAARWRRLPSCSVARGPCRRSRIAAPVAADGAAPPAPGTRARGRVGRVARRPARCCPAGGGDGVARRGGPAAAVGVAGRPALRPPRPAGAAPVPRGPRRVRGASDGRRRPAGALWGEVGEGGGYGGLM